MTSTNSTAKKIGVITFLFFIGIISGVVYAETPVLDLGDFRELDVDTTSNHSENAKLSPIQRITRLEQQIANLVQMDLPGKIDALQQKLQTVQGALERQSYHLSALEKERKQLQALQKQIESQARQLTELTNQQRNQTNRLEILQTTSRNNRARLSAPVLAAAAQSISAYKMSSELTTYRAAVRLLSQRQYKQARQHLQTYLRKYPRGQFRDKAYYWLGEIYYLNGHSRKASWQFKALVDKYPQSIKMPDALLKLALIHLNKGQRRLATQEFNQIVQKFPKTQAAVMAKQHLARISRKASAAG